MHCIDSIAIVTRSTVRSNLQYPAVRAATNMLGAFEDIIHAGTVQPNGAAAALLYSETADIFYDTAGTTGAELRALYIAVR